MVVDGDVLIVAESYARRLTAFMIGADGSLSDRRLWGRVAPTAEPGPMPEMIPRLGFAPDGCTMDAEGHL